MGHEKLRLPSNLVTAINKVKPTLFAKFSLGKAWLYAASPPEYFNATLADCLTLLQAQYGFNPPEHDDWVCLDVVYLVPGQEDFCKGEDFVCPLNSWGLKDPIDYLPSFEEILELSFCKKRVFKNECNKTSISVNPEDIHELLIEKACQQLRDCETLLKLWVRKNRPCEQGQCFSSLDRTAIKQLLMDHERSITFTRLDLHLLSKLDYPQFLIDRYQAILSKECMISKQIKEALRYAK